MRVGNALTLCGRDGPLLPSHTLSPIDIGKELALVCGLPTAIKGKAERQR